MNSPYTFGSSSTSNQLATQNNNLMQGLGGHQLQSQSGKPRKLKPTSLTYYIGGGSHKPSSAQQKSRPLRSQSPLNQLPEKQPSVKSQKVGISSSHSSMMYQQQQNMGVGGGFGNPSGHPNPGMLSGSGKIGSLGQAQTGTPNTAVQYRGYSPSKPKWKNNVQTFTNLGPNVMGGQGGLHQNYQQQVVPP